MRLANPFLKVFFAALPFVLCVSCSSDPEEEQLPLEPQEINNAPIVANQVFEVPEDVGGFATIGTIEASDPEGGALQYFLTSDIELTVNIVSGAIRTKSRSILDFETQPSLTFSIEVRDDKGARTSATITIKVTDVDDGPLTNFQKSFIDEYIFLTYKLSPTASGGPLSEKWQGSIRLFIEGANLPQNFIQNVEGYLNEFRALMTDGTTIELVQNQEDSNVHLIFGPKESVISQWPDMYQLIKDGQFGGYALYLTNADWNIYDGRIWLSSASEGLFKHEFGHILGLGHSSDFYCGDQPTSFMCPFAIDQFSSFDREIMKTLYRIETPVGLTSSEMREVVTEYMLEGDISLKRNIVPKGLDSNLASMGSSKFTVHNDLRCGVLLH